MIGVVEVELVDLGVQRIGAGRMDAHPRLVWIGELGREDVSEPKRVRCAGGGHQDRLH